MTKERKQMIIRYIPTFFFGTIAFVGMVLAVASSKLREYYNVESVYIPINYLVLGFFIITLLAAFVVFITLPNNN